MTNSLLEVMAPPLSKAHAGPCVWWPSFSGHSVKNCFLIDILKENVIVATPGIASHVIHDHPLYLLIVHYRKDSFTHGRRTGRYFPNFVLLDLAKDGFTII